MIISLFLVDNDYYILLYNLTHHRRHLALTIVLNDLNYFMKEKYEIIIIFFSKRIFTKIMIEFKIGHNWKRGCVKSDKYCDIEQAVLYSIYNLSGSLLSLPPSYNDYYFVFDTHIGYNFITQYHTK